MKSLFLLFFIAAATQLFSQTIENVDFRAVGKTIVVSYDLLHPKADTSINVALVFKDQQGVSILPKAISGDIKNVKPGEGKRIIWDVLADGITLSGKYKAEVSIQRYKSVKIGPQVWAMENLNVDRFRNGDPIPQAKTDEEWERAGKNKQPAWCYYENDPKNGETYGKLYNWYAVNDPRGLAPEGWRIPTDTEWTKLSDYLGGEALACKKMKSTSGWANNGNGTNSSGFNGLPGGYRGSNGTFLNRSSFGDWWSASEYLTDYAYGRELYSNFVTLIRSYFDKEKGFSVRCLRD